MYINIGKNAEYGYSELPVEYNSTGFRCLVYIVDDKHGYRRKKGY